MRDLHRRDTRHAYDTRPKLETGDLKIKRIHIQPLHTEPRAARFGELNVVHRHPVTLPVNNQIAPRTIAMHFNAKNHQAFFNDLIEAGFHIFSRRHAKSAGFYPNEFPWQPELDISDIKDGDTITIRAFFRTSKAAVPRIDSGHIDLEVEYVDRDAQIVFGNIVTELPATFALVKGTTVEVSLDEVLAVRAGV